MESTETTKKKEVPAECGAERPCMDSDLHYVPLDYC